jgi:hypothetical protein
MSNPALLDPAVAELFKAENPPVTGVAVLIQQVLDLVESDEYSLDYGSQIRVLTKVQMIVNEKHRLASY